MYEILKKRALNSRVKLMEIAAPMVAKRAEPGQFIMLRVSEGGERIPLTIADFDRARGRVTIVFQEVGKTTQRLGMLEEGETLADFVGPLGMPAQLDGFARAAVVGGGLGAAIAWPQAKKLRNMGAAVDIIAGFRSRELIILEKELCAASTNLFVSTDDGTGGVKGFVTEILQDRIANHANYDVVIAIGPLMMMRAVCDLTRRYGIRTIVSMNSTMIDGTGMCGCCRVIVGGEVKFACIDGPDFDGHLVDFDSAAMRQTMYRAQEAQSTERHICNLEKPQ